MLPEAKGMLSSAALEAEEAAHKREKESRQARRKLLTRERKRAGRRGRGKT